MFNIKIDAIHNINNAGGVQEKFFYNNEYYKIDKTGAEGIAEELSSRVLICSNLKPDEYAVYEYGTINSQKGCKSTNFLTGKELKYITPNKEIKPVTYQIKDKQYRKIPYKKENNKHNNCILSVNI